MIYRTFTISPLPIFLQTESLKETLTFGTTGAVADFYIDDDYLVSNNSYINIVENSGAVAGQIIALIEESGAYALGVITSVDNEQKRILFKSLLNLFDDEVLNPMRAAAAGDAVNVECICDGINGTAQYSSLVFTGDSVDKYRRLPLIIRTEGGGQSGGKYNVSAVWYFKENSFNSRNWLVSLFDTNNVVIQPRLVFEVSRAYIELHISNVTTGGRLIKSNIPGMTITHSESTTPKATVCTVIASDTKRVEATYYLLQNNEVTTVASDPTRVTPHKLVIAEWDKEKGGTSKIIAESALKNQDFSHYISIDIDRESAAFPSGLQIGDAVTIVPEVFDMEQDTPLMTDYSRYMIKTIYTGRKERGGNSRVTLNFGKARISYTDLRQMEKYKNVRR